MTRWILLADDDADDRLLFEEVFSSLPANRYALNCVTNGEEVIHQLNLATDNSNLPDLIILDQNMPLLSGKETVEKLKSVPRYALIPVIIYSTYNDKNFIDGCMKLGVVAVVSKPDSYEGYVQMVHDFLSYALKPVEK
jgi:CheY-like chemotaxis protein